MNFDRYCRHCGEKVHADKGVGIVHCYSCDTPLEHQDIIVGFRRDARVKQLQAMHELMVQANDEDIYMTWIYVMPDEPSEQDFIDIAMDDELYDTCFNSFVKLIAKKGNRW